MINKAKNFIHSYRLFFLNSIEIFFNRILVIFFSFVASILLSRYYSPAEKGVYSLVTTISATAVQFLFLGLPNAYTYYLAKGEATKECVVGNSIVASLLSIAPCLVAYFFMIHVFYYDLLSRKELLIAFLFVPVQLLILYMGQFFLSVNDIRMKNRMDRIESVLLIASLSVIVFFGIKGIDVFLWTTMLFQLVTCCTFVIFIVHRQSLRLKISIELVKKSVRYAFLAYIGCFLAFLILRVDVYMVGEMLGVYDVGIYSTAVNIVDIISVISSSVAALLLPRAAEMDRKIDRYQFTKGVLFTMILILTVVGFLAVLLSGVVIPTVYGKNYAPSVKPFCILVPGTIFWGMESIMGSYFGSESLFSYPLITMTTAFLMNVLLNIFLIPKYGINGAAMASTISYFIAFLLQVLFMNKYKKTTIVLEEKSDA